MSLIDPFLQPGMGDPTVSAESEFQWGPIATWQHIGIVLDATARDSGNTPTTTLRRGLTLGQVTATGKYKEYGPSATDGTQFARGFLYQGRNLLAPITGVAGDRQGSLVFFGNVKIGQLIGFDEQARRQLDPHFVWDDLRMVMGAPRLVLAKTANYQVVNGDDNGKWFTTRGAIVPITFTLPATIQRGNVFRFLNEADQNMIIAAPAGSLVTLNALAATSIAFSTAGQRIGSVVEISVNDDATKYMASLMAGTNTATIV